MRRRIVCGLSETIATLPPQSALTSVDLPTFGRPATATKPDFTTRRCPAAGPPVCARPAPPRCSRRSPGRRRTRRAPGGTRQWPVELGVDRVIYANNEGEL